VVGRERPFSGVGTMIPKAGMTFVEALTFDDVLLRPGHSEVMPSGVDLSSRFTRTITLNIPIVS
jgi:IMP dehydrogenase/GMP reductase